MLSIYDQIDYRTYLKLWIINQSAHSKGGQSKLAEAASVSTALMSQILSGNKHLSLEQANELSDYLGHSNEESQYFFLLVQIGRAGTYKLKQRLIHQAQGIAQKLSSRVQDTTSISESIKSVYYSSWIYAGIRNLVATPGYHDVHTISVRFALPKKIVADAIEFLVLHGLCLRTENGLTYAVQKIHLDATSPFINLHHLNWRAKSAQAAEKRQQNTDIFFTSPMSLSEETATEIRKELPQVIEKIMKKVGPSKSEKIYCLNIDWFEF